MHYFKKNDQVFAFDNEQIKIENLIDDSFISLTDDEIDRHINPEKYYTDEEKQAALLASLTKLTRRQFRLALLNHNLLDIIETKIASVEDDVLRKKIQIEYQDATEFKRTSESVIYMCSLLELSDDEINRMWQDAMLIEV